MVGFSAAAQFMSGPGQSYSVAAFKEPMREALGVSETGYSFSYGVATLISGVSLPFTGRLLDRWGARKLLPLVAALLGFACFVVARVQTQTDLFLGFTLIRCLGQGAMTLIGVWIIGEWFLRKRGLATAVSGLGSSLSIMVIPPLNGWLIDAYGWRRSWEVLGVIVVSSIVVPTLVWLRDRPEELGLTPDGEPFDGGSIEASGGRLSATHPAVAPVQGPVTPIEDSWSVAEVLRDVTFWKLISVPVCAGLVGTGMVFHQISIFAERGVSTKWALGLISLQALVGSVCALGAGWLADRMPTERLLMIAMGLLAGAVAMVMIMNRPWMAVIYAIAVGLQGSILRSAGTVVWVNYYGRQNQGTIRGISMSMMVLAAAIGPLPLALAKDRLHDYTPALASFVVLAVLAGGLVMSARRPERRQQS